VQNSAIDEWRPEKYRGRVRSIDLIAMFIDEDHVRPTLPT
jgi:hypothetical protein